MQGECKGEKETFRPDHITIKTFIIGPNRDEARKNFIINCSYSLCKLVEEMETKPRQNLVYSVSTGLKELFLPLHFIPTDEGREQEAAQEPALATLFCSHKHIL